MKKHNHSVHTRGRIPQATTGIYVGPHRGNFGSSAVAKLACHTDFEGGYFDGSDKAHYLVEDYRGSIVRDCRADGTVVASTEYYPYGEPRTEPTGDNRKWTEGNERLSSSGLPVTDYGPRLMDHARIGWSRHDRLLESTPWLSPYSYCAGNPVALSDPSGDILCLTVAGVEYCYQYGDQGWGFYNGEELLDFWSANRFVQEAYRAISYLMSGPVGYELLNCIINSTTKVSLEPVIEGHDLFGNSCFYRDNNQIFWSLDSRDSFTVLINADGSQEAHRTNIMFNLGHEFWHAVLSIYGYDYKSVLSSWYYVNGRTIYTDDILAVYGENLLREEKGSMLRAGYGFNTDTNSVSHPLNFLNIFNNFFIKNNIVFSIIRARGIPK